MEDRNARKLFTFVTTFLQINERSFLWEDYVKCKR